jgi:hypothetical protein
MKENFGIYSDADGYALDTNIHRRHLRPGARHLVMEMARRRKKENGQMPITKKDMAKQAEVEVGELYQRSYWLTHGGFL